MSSRLSFAVSKYFLKTPITLTVVFDHPLSLGCAGNYLLQAEGLMPPKGINVSAGDCLHHEQ